MLRAVGQVDLAGHGIDRLLLPTPPSLRSLVEGHLSAAGEGAPPVTLLSDSERYGAYGSSRLALACCGTVNTELARARVPQIALYRSTRLTSWLVRYVLRPTLTHAALPNILNARRVSDTAGGDDAIEAAPDQSVVGFADGQIPELLFEDCTSESIAREARLLLSDAAAASRQVAASAHALDDLVAERCADGRPVPSTTLAARAILRHLPT